MKNVFVYLLLMLALSANAQTDTVNLFREVADSTGFGVPDGKLVSQEIGALGGHIVSDDGIVELIFPEGALEKNTTISIQPTVNVAPNGTGKSYQFEPSGIKFEKPVQIIFHYTDEESEVCPPDLMGFALQDPTGKWTLINYDEVDTTSKTLKGFIHHFSSASNVQELRLEADKNFLSVNESTKLSIWGYFKQSKKKQKIVVTVGEIRMLPEGNISNDQTSEVSEDENTEADASESPSVVVTVGRISQEAEFKSNQPILWFVNGIEMGNRSVGYLSVYTEAYKLSKSMLTRSTYTAPESLPSQNPVTVRVDIYVSSGIRKVYHRSESLRCKIVIGQSFKVDVGMDWGKGEGMEFIDHSSFILKISDHVEISDIQNMMMKVVQRQDCKPRYVNEASCTGIINVKGIETASLVPVNSPGHSYTRVDITFQRAPGSAFPVFDFSACPHGRGTTPPVFGAGGFPFRLFFEAKNEKQMFSLGKGNGSPVKKADPEDITATVEPIVSNNNQ